MQAGVSDREFLTDSLPSFVYGNSVRLALSYVAEGRGADVLPTAILDNIFSTPVSARRWLSLASPLPDHSGEDDYFSSDFNDERLRTTFGRLGATKTPLQVLNDFFARVVRFVERVERDAWVY